MTTASYPYTSGQTGRSGNCIINQNYIGARVANIYNIPSGDEIALQRVLFEVGPVAVVIDVKDSFYSYRSGLYVEAACKTNISGLHAVLLVGYGVYSNGQQYWILKNSWLVRFIFYFDWDLILIFSGGKY